MISTTARIAQCGDHETGATFISYSVFRLLFVQNHTAHYQVILLYGCTIYRFVALLYCLYYCSVLPMQGCARFDVNNLRFDARCSLVTHFVALFRHAKLTVSCLFGYVRVKFGIIKPIDNGYKRIHAARSLANRQC